VIDEDAEGKFVQKCYKDVSPDQAASFPWATF
jgi:hypothetical protein